MRVVLLPAQAGITGFASPAAEYTQLSLSLDELLVSHPSATFLGRASGDSMQGLGIFDQDILIIDRAVAVKHLDIVVANLNGEFVCKQLDLKQRLLVSAHKDYPAIAINELDSFSIEGIVVRSIRCHHPSYLLNG